MIETESQELHPKICNMHPVHEIKCLKLKYSCPCIAGYIIRRKLIY